tara:strand:+ start:1715 stop:2200 length:486 start_codon:yes stop_codon:yes gene_type:complete
LSNFQEELRDNDGYEDIVIIAVGQSNISGFNNNFCGNSDLPLVMDEYPSLPIREQFGESFFNEFHKRIIIVGHDGGQIGSVTLNNGLNTTARNYIRNILEEHYNQTLLGDVNGDTVLNIQDVILLVNMIINGETESESADLNTDGSINVLDIIELVNLILN